MKNNLLFSLITIGFLINPICLFAQQDDYILSKKEGLYYNKGDSIPFSGINKVYYENGNIHKKITFNNGKINGSVLDYYTNGDKKFSGYMEMNQKTGKWVSWFKNGQKSKEGVYENNLENGVFKWWKEDGTLIKKGKYINGLEDGIWVWYFENGKKQSKGQFSLGTKVGKWTWWDNRGAFVGTKNLDTLTVLTTSEEKLIGQWRFVHAVDSNNNVIKQYKQNRNIPDHISQGKEIVINIEQSQDMLFNDNRTFSNIFPGRTSGDSGTWKMISSSEIEFTNIYRKNSANYNLMKRTEELIGRKMKYNDDGDIFEVYNKIIIYLTDSEMKLGYEDGLFLIFTKEGK